MPERAAGRAGSDLEREGRSARISILAGCMAGWRSGESGRTKRRRGNSQTWPTRACWRCGHGSPATQSSGDSARREGAPLDPAGSSSWWAGAVGQRVLEASVYASSGPSLVRLFVRSLTVPAPSQADTTDRLRDDVTTTPFTAGFRLSCRLAGSLVSQVLGITGERPTAVECWSWRLLGAEAVEGEGRSLKFVVLEGVEAAALEAVVPPKARLRRKVVQAAAGGVEQRVVAAALQEVKKDCCSGPDRKAERG